MQQMCTEKEMQTSELQETALLQVFMKLQIGKREREQHYFSVDNFFGLLLLVGAF